MLQDRKKYNTSNIYTVNFRVRHQIESDEDYPKFRKILVSVKYVSVILGPEMAAPILWTPGKIRPFCRKSHVHKIPRFRGGGYFGFLGGRGSADFIFMGARIFLRNVHQVAVSTELSEAAKALEARNYLK